MIPSGNMWRVFSKQNWPVTLSCQRWGQWKSKFLYEIMSKVRSIFILATAKSLQSCPTLCDPIDGSPPGSPFPGILQARTLEWIAISFFNAWKWKVKVKSLSCVQLFEIPWTAAHQAPPSMGFSRQEYWSGVLLPSPIFILNHCWFQMLLIRTNSCGGIRSKDNGNFPINWNVVSASTFLFIFHQAGFAGDITAVTLDIWGTSVWEVWGTPSILMDSLDSRGWGISSQGGWTWTDSEATAILGKHSSLTGCL